jgi:tRNA threonylcarbamoyladenosine biosynthesis protein TsaE
VLIVRTARVEDAAQIHEVVRAAFAARPALDPPADALAETPESIARALESGGGIIAVLDGRPVGALLLDQQGQTLFLRRFAVAPDAQGHHVAARMMRTVRLVAGDREGTEELAVLAREELPATVAFWEHQGFREVARRAPLIELRSPARLPGRALRAGDADEMRRWGSVIGAQLRAGDLLILTGELGAGKTTFTQGIAEGLGVRGPITSPTFVLARVHPSLVGGPALVHVDAYRLGSLDELDDLDLDTDFDQAVTIVEWGHGIAEGLSESRLDIRITRAVADEAGETRRVDVTGVGTRWQSLSL